MGPIPLVPLWTPFLQFCAKTASVLSISKNYLKSSNSCESALELGKADILSSKGALESGKADIFNSESAIELSKPDNLSSESVVE